MRRGLCEVSYKNLVSIDMHLHCHADVDHTTAADRQLNFDGLDKLMERALSMLILIKFYFTNHVLLLFYHVV